MQKNQIYWLIFGISLILAILSFVLSNVSHVFNAIAFAFLTVALGVLSWQSLKKRREGKAKTKKSSIDEMLAQQSEDQTQNVQKEKRTLVERSEDFSNGLVPYALVFFTICSLCLFIALL